MALVRLCLCVLRGQAHTSPFPMLKPGVPGAPSWQDEPPAHVTFCVTFSVNQAGALSPRPSPGSTFLPLPFQSYNCVTSAKPDVCPCEPPLPLPLSSGALAILGDFAVQWEAALGDE